LNLVTTGKTLKWRDKVLADMTDKDLADASSHIETTLATMKAADNAIRVLLRGYSGTNQTITDQFVKFKTQIADEILKRKGKS
jgi:UV DNA damage repair endonuclease